MTEELTKTQADDLLEQIAKCNAKINTKRKSNCRRKFSPICR